ncbi:MAG: aminotransferase class I/II-fold pyridoxal phosphate-dependent enzyme [Gemmatimonadota bacterium]|jgi:aromatic-L-amino-acid decarboxylase
MSTHRPSEPGASQATGETAHGDMPPEEFRHFGHEVVDWIADYLAGVDDYPVLARVAPGDVRGALPDAAPEEGEDMADVLRDFDEIVVPGVTHWNHPSFHGYFAVTGSGPGILGEMLSAALNINAMVWRSSPAGTELEEHALDWLRGMIGLPEAFEGVINDTASSSSLYALAAAREAGLPEARENGLSGAPRARIYASAEAHSSIDKAAITLGFGRHGVTRVATDDDFRMDVDALRAAIAEDLARGVRPVAVVATVGTTSTTSVDPVDAVADVAEEHDMWLHVDAAYAGSAAVVPELRPLFRGWERADSVVMNPHKWLFTPVDCSVLYCRRPEMLRAAFSLTPEYLRTSEQGVAKNLMDYGIALGRRFRALKVWFVLRYFGRRGIAHRIREHVRMAAEVASRIDGGEGWERVAPHPFSTVVFRFAPEGVEEEEVDRMNHAILDRVNASGEAFLSHTVLRGRVCLRLSVGNLRTTRTHLHRTWDLLEASAAAVLAEYAGPRSMAAPGAAG